MPELPAISAKPMPELPVVSPEPAPELPVEPRLMAAAEPQNTAAPEIPPQAELVRRVFDGAIVEINGNKVGG
jgi:hypothetical protein